MVEFKTVSKDRTVSDKYNILIIDDELYDQFQDHATQSGIKSDFVELNFCNDASWSLGDRNIVKRYKIIKRSDYESGNYKLDDGSKFTWG